MRHQQTKPGTPTHPPTRGRGLSGWLDVRSYGAYRSINNKITYGIWERKVPNCTPPVPLRKDLFPSCNFTTRPRRLAHLAATVVSANSFAGESTGRHICKYRWAISGFGPGEKSSSQCGSSFIGRVHAWMCLRLWTGVEPPGLCIALLCEYTWNATIF